MLASETGEEAGELVARYKAAEPDRAARIARLRTLDPLLIDNSIRESTVVQIYGHIEADKDAMLEAVEPVGAQYVVVGAFGDLERVEDKWLSRLNSEGRILPHWITFSEMVEWTKENEEDVDELYALCHTIHPTPTRTLALQLWEFIGCG